MQCLIELHLTKWYLIPFASDQSVPGVWGGTWLCLSLRLSR